MTTSDRIQEELNARGWSRLDLAKHSGVKEHTIYAWLRRDSQRMDSGDLAKVADCLGLTLDWLIAGRAPKRRRKA